MKTTGHHATHVGLQKHSVGEIYPWTIEIRGGHTYESVCTPLNCITGERGPAFDASCLGFSVAHNAAEQWAKRVLRASK